MEKRVFKVDNAGDLERCYPVIKELRPHLTFEQYIEIYQDSHRADGYEIVAIESAGRILAVMGYRYLSDFVRGRHLYVDDLVSTESMRSQGLGAELLQYAEGLAKENGCKSLRLCTGVENERAMTFYERNGWTKRSVAYTKKLAQ
ncbi:MAG: GNAT family N-acetyltransferase [Bdellovibrionales bacterium]